MRSGDKPPPVKLSDTEGSIVADVNWQLNKFSEYFHSVFHREQIANDLRSPYAGNHDEPFSEAEVTLAIKRQKITGAVGCDGISASKLQYCPEDLRCGVIVPVYKYGNLSELRKVTGR